MGVENYSIVGHDITKNFEPLVKERGYDVRHEDLGTMSWIR